MTDPIAFIIEDDYDASQIFAKALEVQGIKTEAIYDGEKALERLRTAVPFIIVLDLHLPNVDGTEILAWIRSMPALKETLVIVVTADARMGETLEDKADLVLLKPATFTQIRDFTARLINRKRQVQAEADSAQGALSAESTPPAESMPIPEIDPIAETIPAVELADTAPDLPMAATDEPVSDNVPSSAV